MTGAVQAQMAGDIEEAGGREVFFIGKLSPEGLIIEAEAHAVGTSAAVPVLTPRVRAGEIVLHNHPTGNLEPSDADLNVAAGLAQLDVAFAIVDNAVREIRLVVKPKMPPRLVPLDPEAIAAELGPGGPLARELQGHEARHEQQEMARLVADAFNRDALAVIEAGTGTGKSFAYLLPALRWAVQNGERVVVSTNTINLQEQLIGKDLPLLVRALGLEAKFELLKGRGNYVCQRKTEAVRAQAKQQTIDLEKPDELQSLLAWIATTKDGSLGELPQRPSPDVWELVVSDADNCLRLQCPHHETCFFYGARRRAAHAQILVVNHSLLMADLALRMENPNPSAVAVLPPYTRLIVDEAHNLEEVAVRHFAKGVSREAARRALMRIHHPRTGRGLLRALANAVFETPAPKEAEDAEARDRALILAETELCLLVDHALASVDGAFNETIHQLLEHLGRAGTPPRRGEPLSLRIGPAARQTPFWQELSEGELGLARGIEGALHPVVEGIRQLLEAVREARLMRQREVQSAAMELRAQSRRLERLLRTLRSFLDESPGRCRWLELAETPRGRRLQAIVAPLDLRSTLRDTLFRRLRTVVLTSATLTVQGSFDFLVDRIGLGAREPEHFDPMAATADTPAEPALELDGDTMASDVAPEPEGGAADRPLMLRAGFRLEPPPEHIAPPTAGELHAVRRRLRMIQLDSPFDYNRQAIVAGIAQMPEPGQMRDFVEAFARAVLPACEASRGRALLLFTSYGMLDATWRRMEGPLRDLGLQPMRQAGQNRHRLLEDFKGAPGPVLFGTSSFWEGVDVRGDGLVLLVIAQLPFAVPTEPLHQARMEWLRERGEEPFRALALPQAVLRFRQGFGRLIRGKEDRGAVLVADPRLHTKPYGGTFRRSLPVRQVRLLEAAQCPAAIREILGLEPWD